MLRKSAVISISLPPEDLTTLQRLTTETSKTRSEIIRELLAAYSQKRAWEQIFAWGRETKEKFNIRSEEDILKIIND